MKYLKRYKLFESKELLVDELESILGDISYNLDIDKMEYSYNNKDNPDFSIYFITVDRIEMNDKRFINELKLETKKISNYLNLKVFKVLLEKTKVHFIFYDRYDKKHQIDTHLTYLKLYNLPDNYQVIWKKESTTDRSSRIAKLQSGITFSDGSSTNIPKRGFL